MRYTKEELKKEIKRIARKKEMNICLFNDLHDLLNNWNDYFLTSSSFYQALKKSNLEIHNSLLIVIDTTIQEIEYEEILKIIK